MENDQSKAIKGFEQLDKGTAFQFWLMTDEDVKKVVSARLYERFKGIILYAHNDLIAVDLECQPPN
jgi:hypothetical protein